MKKKPVRQNRAVKGLLSISMIFLSAVFLFSAARDLETFIQLNMEIQANTVLKESKADKKADLEKERSNLTNNDYLIDLGRKEFNMIKDDESLYIFQGDGR